jgi:hypothetical protein
MHDGYAGAAAILKTGADINGDGKADSYPDKNLDHDFYPNAFDLDSDSDGIVDVIESGLPDNNLDGKADGIIGVSGWSQTVMAMPVLQLRNSDGTGNPDYLDIDADDDGIPDNIEGQSTDGYKLPQPTDSDGDGLADTYDNVIGFGGSGIFIWDEDGDGLPDYRDFDSDGDGQADIIEGNDFNLNGFADDLVTLTGVDSDGDGLDNRFDSLNSVSNIKGTSYNMGNGGSTAGDASPGTKSPVQKKLPSQLNRDFRYVGVVLPVRFLSLNGTLQNSTAMLQWTVIAATEVERFELERSYDNAVYTKVAVITGTIKLNEPQSFSYNDDVAGVTKDIIYYRLKVLGKNGELKYSNVLVLRQHRTKTIVSIAPNPARDVVALNFVAGKESVATIKLVDNWGNIVLQQDRKVLKGNNELQLKNLSQYSVGVYTIQLFVNDELTIQKLILLK